MKNTDTLTQQPKNRLASLDILRGMTIIGMILVNTQGVGQSFPWLRHCTWDGCVFADIVYPFFIFILGAAIFMVLQKRGNAMTSRLATKVLARGALIFLLGIVINNFPFRADFAYWRIPGVLQRIAIVYVVAMFAVTSLKSLRNIALLTIAILLGYWGLLHFEGASLTNNPVVIVDRFIFGESHLYRISGVCFDPEGLLNSLPALASALLGYMTAAFLTKESAEHRFPYLTGCFAIALIAGGLLWNMVLPFNKPLWTSSFVLYTSGLATALWLVLYVLTDIKNWGKYWSSLFMVFGTNALLTYLISEFIIILNYTYPLTLNGRKQFVHLWLDQWIFHYAASPYRSLLWGISVVVICWLIALPLYKKRIFVKL